MTDASLLTQHFVSTTPKNTHCREHQNSQEFILPTQYWMRAKRRLEDEDFHYNQYVII